jgi:hypothetical protein
MSDRLIPGADRYEDLLVPIFVAGKLVYEQPSLVNTQARAREQVQLFLNQTESYAVTLEPNLLKLQKKLSEEIR